MTQEELTQELASEGLRLASEDEAGWYYHIYDPQGGLPGACEENETTITVWVTDL